MSHRSLPPSASRPGALNAASLLRMMPSRPTPIASALVKSDELPASEVSLTKKRPAYSVERFPAMHGCIYLVGYDRNGDVMVELRMPLHRFNERTIERMKRWMMKNDEPTLSLVDD